MPACARLLAWADGHNVALGDVLRRQVEAGFGESPDGSDRFDALVGVLGVLNVIKGHRPVGEPSSGPIRRIEGWILGQDYSIS